MRQFILFNLSYSLSVKCVITDEGLKKLIPKEDQIKLPLEIAWLKNFNRSVMLYKQDIDHYAEQLSKTNRKELIETCTYHLNKLNRDEEYYLIYKNTVANWIDAVTTFEESIDKFKDKLFNGMD